MARPVIEVTCAIIVEGEEVLVTQRGPGMLHPLKWEFPGGKLKPGEHPDECIIREIREELGVQISVDRLLPVVSHGYMDHIVNLIPFVCRIIQGEINLSEHNACLWVHPSELDRMDWLEADLEVVELFRRSG